ncbi:hypothetical protein VTO42DRAFT_7280 [Malbranchea cinnamomea]
MGNDGGSIPTRRELVREAARNPSVSQVKEALREHLEHFWSTCALSHKKLTQPIVSDGVGNLYNKDAVIQYLLPGEEGEGTKADCEEVLRGRIKSIRDVVEVKFEVDNGVNSGGKGAKWICPVTQKELGPSVKSVYIVPCGHAFSEEAIREMKSDNCLQCNEPYEADNVIPILPVKEEEKERLKRRLQQLAEQGLTHSLKKVPGSKKRKKNGEVGRTKSQTNDKTVNAPSAVTSGPASHSATPMSGIDSRTDSRTSTPSASSGINNAATAMLTARVLEEENKRQKRRKMMGTNETYKGLFTSNQERKSKDGDFMTRGYSISSSARR